MPFYQVHQGRKEGDQGIVEGLEILGIDVEGALKDSYGTGVY